MNGNEGLQNALKSYGVEKANLSEYSEYQKMLAAAMRHIESQGELEMVLLKDDSLRKWWSAYKNHLEVERKRVATIDKLIENFDADELKYVHDYLALGIIP